MRALVTGGAGFIGSHLCEALLEKHQEVICLDNFWRGKKENIKHLLGNKNFKLVKGDINDKKILRSLLEDTDIIYHLAAINGTKYFYEQPLLVMKTNIYGTENILESALNGDIKRVVFASSSEIYGEAKEIPTPENAVCHLDNPVETFRHSYSGSKFIGELICLSYYKNYGLPITILRYFNTYGPRLIGTSYGQVVSIFINRILSGKNPIIYGDGNQTRSFTYIDDTVNATIVAAENKKTVGEVLNIGMDKEITINELSELIANLCDIKIKPIYEKEKKGDCRRRCPDISKARKILKWEPKTTLEEGLKITINWFKEKIKK
ncbi:MAG: GDP-mannose 4,6-dehydratase [Thermoplasmatales archaeon]|nr:GDP-mannose 4,6-dehydratase [Thermoplasmatales archaeon]